MAARSIFELLGRLRHQALVHLAHALAFTLKKAHRLVHLRGIVSLTDLAGARARTSLDLEQQARSRAAVVDAVGAGPQQECALQHIDGAVDRAGRGKRPEIVVLAAARTAVLQDARRRVLAGNAYIGKRFVIPHQHVEAWTEALDQVGFKQQRLRLGAHGDEFHRRR